MAKYVPVLPIILLFFFFGFLFSSTASASFTSTKSLSSIASEAVSIIAKWIQSLRSTAKTATSARPMMKFESGYTVQTVFDGSMLGIEPYSVEILPGGKLLMLDSANSNIYKISASLSPNTRPRLIAGSAEGSSGHIDGKLGESRMNHPKGIAVDDRGNVYVADALNFAIRKISSSGVTTIAGGRTGRGGSHVDGPSEEAKFSDDFDVVYIGSSCSILVVDRGNQAIREIPLRFDDCVYQNRTGFPLGVIILIAASLLGYVTAMVCWRGQPVKVRPPLIPSEGVRDKQEEGLFSSLCSFLVDAGMVVVEIVGGVFPVFSRRHEEKRFRVDPWPAQESYEFRAEEVPPSETRAPTPLKTYAFMSKGAERIEQQSDAICREWKSGIRKEQLRHRQYYRYSSPQARTVFKPNPEEANGIVLVKGVEHKEGWSYEGYDF